MKKNNLTLILFVLIGLLAGSILGEWLAPVQGLSFLTKSAQLTWQPKADLQIIAYNLDILIKVNMLSIAGIAAAIWLYRKL
ncbi:hypothetical protein J31TS4_24740 [Paenibacillus sp. J31TS4]|uniref:DUF4321 domain-containing protein n=1 Tax=Paenibacillus sp. J31TS4 TaxID=2807195 RepID=UPI001B205669|nr:DUF4321 domain-containing protein [Paenibacillus sp. J31TS4]GIP39194.1 hypothetical protein J31TS4_24740 [Paenibacillus sp. J31TS4]